MKTNKENSKNKNNKNDKQTKTVIPWMGGKSKLITTLLQYFPKHTCYAEPFAGSAALFFAKAPSRCEVINDRDGELMNLYRVVQNHLEAFLDQFQWMLSSREHFDRFKTLTPEQLTDIQRAVRFYYLQKHAFGGQTHKRTFGTATTARPRLNSYHMIKSLQDAHERLKQAYIENLPWQKIIQKYDRSHTLFYCDPPYWQVAGYGKPFVWQEYVDLKNAMQTTKGMMLISLNDHPDIRALFEGFTMIPLETSYTMSKKQTVAKELLILNDHAHKALGK